MSKKDEINNSILSSVEQRQMREELISSIKKITSGMNLSFKNHDESELYDLYEGLVDAHDKLSCIVLPRKSDISDYYRKIKKGLSLFDNNIIGSPVDKLNSIIYQTLSKSIDTITTNIDLWMEAK